MVSKAKKILSAILAGVLCAGTLAVTTPDTLLTMSTVEAAESINGHELIAETGDYALYLNEDDLSLVVADKETGAYMESSISYDDGNNNATWLGAMKSALVITLINQNDDTKQADLVNDDVNKKITYTDNGFSAELYWNKYQIGMTLDVSLTDEGLVAHIADDSIKEESDTYQIGTISIYPFMGNSYLDDKAGYLFIPDGNGALIYLDDKEGRFNSGYSAMIYGSDIGFDESEVVSLLWDKYDMVTDSEQVIAPVYGIAHTDDGIAYLAVVEDGAMRATIEAKPNGVSVDYNRVYAKFIERKLYTQPTSNNTSSGSLHIAESDRSHSDLQVRFLFLSGDEANYAGMANAYRDYLLESGQLTAQDDTYRTRVDFLGTDRESWVLGTTAVTMTTTDDIREIYEDLQANGVDSLFSVYKGWQSGGLYNVPISSYKADSNIGGTKDLTALMEEAEAQDIAFYLYNDALRINPDENNATFNVVKKVNKRKYEESTYKDVYETMMYITPAKSNQLLTKFVSVFTKKTTGNLALAGITNKMYSYTYSGETYTRYDCGQSYADTIASVDSQTSSLVLEQPFAYLWANTDSFLDMPLYTSSYIYEDESVPFLSIVLKGVMPVYAEYVNFEANKQEFFLKMIETGSYPSFYITMESSADLIYTNSSDIYSSQYEVYADMIAEYDSELAAINADTAGAYIIGHEIYDNGVRKVTYDNGVTIYLNYSDTAQTQDGYDIEAMSYKVGE